jgi:hypothetical protein
MDGPIGPGEFEAWLTVLRDLPGDRFELVLKTVEDQLARNHEVMMVIEETRRQAVAAELAAEANRRSDRLLLCGLMAGLVIVLGMTTASIVVGPWPGCATPRAAYKPPTTRATDPSGPTPSQRPPRSSGASDGPERSNAPACSPSWTAPCGC